MPHSHEIISGGPKCIHLSLLRRSHSVILFILMCIGLTYLWICRWQGIMCYKGSSTSHTCCIQDFRCCCTNFRCEDNSNFSRSICKNSWASWSSPRMKRGHWCLWVSAGQYGKSSLLELFMKAVFENFFWKHNFFFGQLCCCSCSCDTFSEDVCAKCNIFSKFCNFCIYLRPLIYFLIRVLANTSFMLS